MAWAREAQQRGAGEIVLNCMNNDGVKRGYDLDQLALVRDAVSVPVIASGGAGDYVHFADLFEKQALMAVWRRPCSIVVRYRSRI